MAKDTTTHNASPVDNINKNNCKEVSGRDILYGIGINRATSSAGTLFRMV
jgi:hypothetical protein